jgi:hypothetical protein
MKPPLIVNLGMGVDSVAMLVGLHQRNERPDLIIFADTGCEKPETLAYLPALNGWLAGIGWPQVTVVKRPVGPAGYRTLEENCLRNETLPSLAFNMKGCSLKWKADAMDAWILGIKRGPNKRPPWPMMSAAIAAGVRAIKCIGYDAGPKDSRRGRNHVGTKRDRKFFTFRYPLREWGWDRARCIEEIIRASLPVPLKSACFFCPASQPWELYWLAAVHPTLFLRAVALEDRARNGKHGLHEVKGLWGRDITPTARRKEHVGSWRTWAERVGIFRGEHITAPRAQLLKRAEELRALADEPGVLPCAA